jgi:hypothetical protein
MAGAVVGLAAVALCMTGLPAVGSFGQERSLAELHFADFNAVLGQRFSVHRLGEAPISTQLVAVKRSAFPAAGGGSPQTDCFALTFCSAKGGNMTQGVYTFAHRQLGYFDLFVVPTQPVDHEERYVAIFNRI